MQSISAIKINIKDENAPFSKINQNISKYGWWQISDCNNVNTIFDVLAMVNVMVVINPLSHIYLFEHIISSLIHNALSTIIHYKTKMTVCDSYSVDVFIYSVDEIKSQEGQCIYLYTH